MPDSSFILDYDGCLAELRCRLSEPAPTRIQLLVGPRQVGKTTLLLQLHNDLGPAALYTTADGPAASLPGYWERLWVDLEERVRQYGSAWLLLDEAPHLSNWANLLKGESDRLMREKMPIHILATGSSALGVGVGSRESLAGRFERLTLSHWGIQSLARAFSLSPEEAFHILVEWGAYPGAMNLLQQPARWLAYLRDAIVAPALGRDLIALTQVRKPALLRQLFALCVAHPAQIVSLQKLQGQLQEPGALETLAHYLSLLEEAFLVASLQKFSDKAGRRRAAPPKLVALSNAFLRVSLSDTSPLSNERRGHWLENACLAHCWNSGQSVTYWREESLEVDAVVEGSWGGWALEITEGEVRARAIEGLAEFTRRHPSIKPLVVCRSGEISAARRLGLQAITPQEFLMEGPRGT